VLRRGLARRRNPWGGAVGSDKSRLDVPDHELFACLHGLRRPLIKYLRSSSCSQRRLDAICDGAVRVSATSNVGDAPEARKWALCDGKGNRARIAALTARTAGALDEEADAPPEVIEHRSVLEAINSRSGCIVLDVGLMQVREQHLRGAFDPVPLTLRATRCAPVAQMTLDQSHPQALPPEAISSDVKKIFGESMMQVSCVERTSRRTKWRLVGSAHVLSHWSAKEGARGDLAALPPLQQFREYVVAELYPAEKAWLPQLLEPFKAGMPQAAQQSCEWYMPEEPLPEDAQTCTLSVVFGRDQVCRGARVECASTLATPRAASPDASVSHLSVGTDVTRCRPPGSAWRSSSSAHDA
jgi:hypothetical protein